MLHRPPLVPVRAAITIAAALFSSGCLGGGDSLLGGPFPTGPEIFIEWVRVEPGGSNQVVESGRSDVNQAVIALTTGDVMYARALWKLDGSTVTRQSAWRSSDPAVLRMEALQDIDLTHVGSTPTWLPLSAIAAGQSSLTVGFKDPAGSLTGTASIPVRVVQK